MPHLGGQGKEITVYIGTHFYIYGTKDETSIGGLGCMEQVSLAGFFISFSVSVLFPMIVLWHMRGQATWAAAKIRAGGQGNWALIGCTFRDQTSICVCLRCHDGEAK